MKWYSVDSRGLYFKQKDLYFLFEPQQILATSLEADLALANEYVLYSCSKA